MKKLLVFIGWGMVICLLAWSTAGYAQVSVSTVNNRVVQGGTTSSVLQPIVQSSSSQAQSGGTSTSSTQTSQGSTSTQAQASGATTQTNTQQQAAATRDTKVADSAVATVKNTVDATYNSQTQEFTFTDANGQQKTMKLTDISGLTKDWIDKAGIQNGDKIKLGLSEDGKAILVTNSDKDGNKVWEYDSQSHAMSYYHTSGALKGKLDYVTSESSRKYTFRGEGKDPGVGKDGHVITQKCFYDSNNNLSKIEYYTWSAENRGKNGAAKKSDQQRYTRYKYREDTFTTPTGTCDVTATACSKPSNTKYFDDPRPINWEPVLKGTVTQDNQGRYFLKTKNDDGTVSYYMLTARQDGFDADGDGKSGAAEMNGINWSTMVGKEITVRGHQIGSEQETDTYFNSNAAEMFAVVDVITTDAEQKVLSDWQSSGIDQKVTDAMAKAFTTLGNENDINKIYDKVYKAVIAELKKAGVSEADVDKFATQKLKDLWGTDTTKKATTSSSSGTSSIKSTISNALSALKSNNVSEAKTALQGVINQFQSTALSQQKSLTDFPVQANVDNFSELNSVGMAYYQLAQQALKENDSTKALEMLKYITDNLKFSQYQNPDNTNDLWKLADKARSLMDEINKSSSVAAVK